MCHVTARAMGTSPKVGDCDFTCKIIIISVVSVLFGVLSLCVLLPWICIRHRKRSSHLTTAMIQMVSPKKSAHLEKLEQQVGEFLDGYPEILDMSDYKIPSYLQEHIPGLSDNDARDALAIVAKRRVALV